MANRKVSDKDLVRTLFSKHVRKALKKMVAASRAGTQAKGRKSKGRNKKR